jgi:NAD(P) transhydrogenase subunit alpha
MIVATVQETFPGESRVAMTPGAIPALLKAGLEVLVQAGAGTAAGFPDEQYREKGARIVASRSEVFQRADAILQVRLLGANLEAGRADLEWLRPGQVIIGHTDPLGAPQACAELAGLGVTAYAMELMPRITRAQSMDALSSQATVAGYQAVLLAAERLPRLFPMMMTAAGTISPARVFVVGAGVAGLQAIATARRLGARVAAFDVRPAVKEQVESLGARFVELDLEDDQAEDQGGYARARDEEFYRRQREMMTHAVAESDVVITTAAIPGKQAPLLITTPMVAGMAAGSVIIDLAAERGGNVEPSRPDETVIEGGVTILGPTNLPAAKPYHASQMYARNISTFLIHLIHDDTLKPDREDEITRGTLLSVDGQVVQARVRELLGLAPAEAPGSPASPEVREE